MYISGYAVEIPKAILFSHELIPIFFAEMNDFMFAFAANFYT